MFELIALFALVVTVAMVVAMVSLTVGLAKLVFKVALIPVALVFGVFKVALGALGIVLLLAVGVPVAIAGFFVLLPLLLLGALLFGGACLVSSLA